MRSKSHTWAVGTFNDFTQMISLFYVVSGIYFNVFALNYTLCTVDPWQKQDTREKL
jgi:hypothetical protein